MRIAEISTLFRPVPPEGEGSVESLVASIVEGLAARGHDVALFARADSRTSARLISPVPEGFGGAAPKWDWQLYEAFQVREAMRAARDFNVMHCHSYHHAMMFAPFAPTPVLSSIHVEPGPDIRFLAEKTPGCHLHFASHYQAREFRDLPNVEVIPHGIDVARYRPPETIRPGDYLAFLGRFIPEKGPLEAIRFAQKLGMPLKLAAPPNAYYEETLKPRIDGRRIEYVGELKGAEKAEFFAGARALLYPLQRPEPFGLVLIEAMASGLPAIAPAMGAIPEIVEHGETGWLYRGEDEIDEAVKAVGAFDRKEIRRRAEIKFDVSLMVERLEKLLVELAGEALQ